MTIPRLDAAAPMPDSLRGGIIALGNFDGFHLGHQAVVGEALRWARDEGRPCIIATLVSIRFRAARAAEVTSGSASV